MKIRNYFWAFVLLSIMLVTNPLSAEDWLPDPNLRMAIRETLRAEIGLPDHTPLTKEHLKHLTHLDVRNNGISDLIGLEHATNLQDLNADSNQISDLTPLSALFRLHTLSLRANQISDISPLSNLTTLHRLNLALNQVSDITSLENLTGLRWLDLEYNQMRDISVLSNLTILEDLRLTSNLITDFSPLANLTRLKRLSIKENFNETIAPLRHLNIEIFHYAEVCEVVSPTSPSIEERVLTRTYPSLSQSAFYVTNLPREISETYHDLHINDFTPYQAAEIEVHITEDRPTEGLANRLSGRCDIAAAIYQQRLNANPNHLLLFGTGFYSSHAGGFPEDSDVWLRDATGQIVAKDVNQPWLEYQIDLVKPHVQDILIEHIVGIAKSGLYDGIAIDGFVNDGAGFIGRELHPASDEEIRAAYKRILHETRLQVPEDFLILANAGIQKPVSFTEYVNGSFIETGPEIKEAGYTYRELIDIEEAFLWYEENLRYPQINVLQGIGIGASESPTSQRWMRVFTTLTLTHSNGYLFFGVEDIDRTKDRIWYDFYDAPLGRPVGGAETKGQPYDNRDGVFIREFTNGWAVYNRSGTEQQIEFTGSTTGVSSGSKASSHVLPDLDGEIYLKADEMVGLSEDDIVEIDTTNTADTAEWIPDVNLQMAIREVLGEKIRLPDHTPLTKAHLKHLVNLEISNSGISDLTGLEHATYLGDFGANGNQISDLTPLSGLFHLHTLTLHENQISDISPLANLTTLHRLNLSTNQISNITPLENLTGLRWLNLERNQIEDLSVLRNLKILEELRLTGNLITNFSPIVNLTKLKELHIKNNPLKNIAPLLALDLDEFEYDEAQLKTSNPVDVTGDGIVNILDLVVVANAFGEAEPDLNSDGVVNIQDLVIVANAFGN